MKKRCGIFDSAFLFYFSHGFCSSLQVEKRHNLRKTHKSAPADKPQYRCSSQCQRRINHFLFHIIIFLSAVLPLFFTLLLYYGVCPLNGAFLLFYKLFSEELYQNRDFYFTTEEKCAILNSGINFRSVRKAI